MMRTFNPGRLTCFRRHNLRLVRALTLLILTLPTFAFAAPAIFYTDLAKGPNTGGDGNLGAYVTIFGAGFGSTQGTVTIGGGAAASYKSWSDTKIVVQLGSNAASGSIVVR